MFAYNDRIDVNCLTGSHHSNASNAVQVCRWHERLAYLYNDNVVLAVVGVLPAIHRGVSLGVLHDDAFAQVVYAGCLEALLPELQRLAIVLCWYTHKPAVAAVKGVTRPWHVFNSEFHSCVTLDLLQLLLLLLLLMQSRPVKHCDTKGAAGMQH